PRRGYLRAVVSAVRPAGDRALGGDGVAVRTDGREPPAGHALSRGGEQRQGRGSLGRPGSDESVRAEHLGRRVGYRGAPVDLCRLVSRSNAGVARELPTGERSSLVASNADAQTPAGFAMRARALGDGLMPDALPAPIQITTS